MVVGGGTDVLVAPVVAPVVGPDPVLDGCPVVVDGVVVVSEAKGRKSMFKLIGMKNVLTYSLQS